MKHLIIVTLLASVAFGGFADASMATKVGAAMAWGGTGTALTLLVLRHDKAAAWPAAIGLAGMGAVMVGDRLTEPQLHAGASGAIYALGYVGARQVMRPLPAALTAGVFTLGVGACKEWHDSRQADNFWSWDDMKWNCVGVASSAVLTAGIDWLMSRRR